MSLRLLRLACLTAVLFAVVDPASARPRRAAKRWFAPAPVVAPVSQAPAASAPLQQVIYPVADLVVPIPSRTSLDVEPLPRPASKDTFAECGLNPWGAAQTPSKLLPGQTLEHQLMDLVTSTVASSTWSTGGGAGTIQFYPLSLSLVVNQTREVHDEVGALLAALRRLQDVEAAIEIRAVTVAPAAFQRACKQLNITPDREQDNAAVAEPRVVGPKGKRWTAFLDNCQVRELLNLVQTDRGTCVTQAPKVTMFSGQNTALEITQERGHLTALQVNLDVDSNPTFTTKQAMFATGLRLGLNPVIAADRRSTRVRIKGYWCEPAGPVERHATMLTFPRQGDDGKEEKVPFGIVLQKPTFSQVRLDQDFTLPDGGTALVSCGVVPTEVDRDDFSACWHGFWTGEKLTASADRHVFFLVTSRIIVHEESETPTAVEMPRP